MTQTTEATPARLYALLAGSGLLLGGVGGFFYDASFGVGSELTSDKIIGTFATNGWHNLLHLLAGLIGLALASRAPRAYALGAGAFFTVLALWGMLETDRGVGSLLDLIPVDTGVNLLHLLLGIAGLAGAAAGRELKLPGLLRARRLRKGGREAPRRPRADRPAGAGAAAPAPPDQPRQPR